MGPPKQAGDAPPVVRPSGNARRIALGVVKVVVVVLVVAFVAQAAGDGFADLRERGIEVHPAAAFAACLAYAASQFLMAHYWRHVLLALGQPAPWHGSIAAYHVSQIGKYVPGKASVVLIRTERLAATLRRDSDRKSQTFSVATVGASVFYETLTLMAVGSLLSAALTLANVSGAESRWWVVLLSLGLAAICLTPTLPPVFSYLLEKVTKGARSDRLRRPLGYGLAASGATVSVVAWATMGVSAYLAAEAVGATGGRGLGSLPLWTLAATLPPVAGFVSLLPAGAVVREALTLGLLAPALGEANALAVTVAVRLVGLATEVTLCASLLVCGAVTGRSRPDDHLPPDRAT